MRSFNDRLQQLTEYTDAYMKGRQSAIVDIALAYRQSTDRTEFLSKFAEICGMQWGMFPGEMTEENFGIDWGITDSEFDRLCENRKSQSRSWRLWSRFKDHGLL